MYTIENNRLKVEIVAKGAELNSIFHKEHGLEYMWSADPKFWAKKSPILFPIVGTLKENTYFYNGQSYHLSRHGFAREREFSVAEHSADAITFSLDEDAESLKVFPFHFKLQVTYTVQADELTVTYSVLNKESSKLFFSIGGHPAFKVPLVEGTSYSDYQLHFNQKETAGLWPISKEGLIQKEPVPFFENSDVIPLTKKLFEQDALVFKNLRSHAVSLRSDKTPHGLTFQFPHFPFLGIWAAPNADFVCIEPWCGIADAVDTTQQLEQKEGIKQLQGEQKFEISWQARFF